jgi:hypothetical protein
MKEGVGHLTAQKERKSGKSNICKKIEKGDVFLFDGAPCRKIRLIESNVKCRYLKKLTSEGVCMRPPPLLGFCLGW